MIDTTKLRELAKMTPEQNTDYERLKQAAASVWSAGNMYIGPSMRELMRFFGEYKRLSPEYEQPAGVPVAYMTRDGIVASRRQVETNTAGTIASGFTIPLYTVPPAPSVPEPVGEAVDFNGWRIVRWKVKESSFPLGTKFYTAPPAPSVPDSDLVIDLKHASYDALTAAARRSKWIPPEYVSNDWIADCINFLENGHPAVPADLVRDAER